MAHISNSILRGLSTLVNEQLNYVSLVEYQNIRWYLCLGRKKFYFIDEELKKYKFPGISYDCIEACRLCKTKKTLMQLLL